MKRFVIVFGLAAAASASLPAASQASGRRAVVAVAQNHDRHEGRDARSAFRYGYDRGWREGSREGRSDGRRHRDERFWREGDFRHADSGYRRWMGPRPEYMRGYREGYAQGYRRAYKHAR
jgi:flagellar biosynthesis/type III secretory pathway protein FliH